jgi:acyl-CoA synthetase (NDP forming)
MNRLFAPDAVALVGLPGDLERPGGRPLRFLRRHAYRGRIYPVNPRHREIGGLPAYPALTALPGPVDVAWIGLPAAQAPGALEQCGRMGIPFAVVLGAGFAETGGAGEVAQAHLRAAARTAGVRVVGPNTIGFVNGWDGVALTFSPVGEVPALTTGPVALLSQSGGVGGCLLNRAIDRGPGVGLFVSTGNEADLGLADYLDWLIDDGRARAVACVIEQVRAPERFAACVRRAVSRGVPVVARKLGGSPAGARAARSHTGALVGSREAWRAWAGAAGLLEVPALEHLVDVARYLAQAPPLAGGRAAMVTSSGGIAVLLADALEPGGFTFERLQPETARRVAALLPPYATVDNPLDITAGLPDPVFGEVLTAVVADPGVDCLVVPLTMATAARGRARADEVVRATRGAGKPVAVCWPGGSLVEEGFQALAAADIPLFHTVADCAAALGTALAFQRVRARLAETPSPGEPAPSRLHVELGAGAGALPWAQMRRLLDVAGLRLPPEVIVRSLGEAPDAVSRVRYPAVVKLLGPLHKTEVGGVRLGLADPGAVLAAIAELLPQGDGCLVQPMIEGVEVLVGGVVDPALGPFVVVAPGGIHAELFGERAMRPAPVTAAEAERMIGECPALATLLAGRRGGRPGDRRALVETVARASRLIAALGPRLDELDLNPVMVGPEDAVVVDGRIILTPSAREESTLGPEG